MSPPAGSPCALDAQQLGVVSIGVVHEAKACLIILIIFHPDSPPKRPPPFPTSLTPPRAAPAAGSEGRHCKLGQLGTYFHCIYD